MPCTLYFIFVNSGGNHDSDNEENEDDLVDEPLAKKMKSSVQKPILDQYQATNYVPEMSNEERESAEAELLAAKNSLISNDINGLYLKTRNLQRHHLSSSVKDQFEKFPWLENVRFF